MSKIETPGETAKRLLPCPFCGARLEVRDDHHGEWVGHPESDCLENIVQIFDERDVERWNRRDPSELAEAEAKERALSLDREWLGKLVRLAWVQWAKTQPDAKPSWLLPWEELAERDKEDDRQIGEFIASQCVTPDLVKAEANGKVEGLRMATNRWCKAREGFHATYNGGHHEKIPWEAFHHGMDTVFNALDDWIAKIDAEVSKLEKK